MATAFCNSFSLGFSHLLSVVRKLLFAQVRGIHLSEKLLSVRLVGSNAESRLSGGFLRAC